MVKPARLPDCKPIEHILGELGCAISSMDNLPQNLGELCQELLDKMAYIPVELDLPQLPSNDIRYAHAAKFSNINKCHRKFTKIHIKQNSANNT